jgi:uncharacterized tellurite resistance protein B-like protein
MLERIQGFFQNITGMGKHSEFAGDDIRVSLAALCFQVIEADGLVHDAEVQKLRDLIENYFELEKSDIDHLMEISREAGKEAVDYYRFTSEIKRQLTVEQCREFVGVLWDLVKADGKETEMEDHVIWRISDLLGVAEKDVSRHLADTTLGRT